MKQKRIDLVFKESNIKELIFLYYTHLIRDADTYSYKYQNCEPIAFKIQISLHILYAKKIFF